MTCSKCGSDLRHPNPDDLRRAANDLLIAIRDRDTMAEARAEGAVEAYLRMVEWYFRGVCVICAPVEVRPC